MPAYDGAQYIQSQLSQKTNAAKKNVFQSAMWVNVPVLIKGKSMVNGIPPSKITYNLLAAKSFKAQRYLGDNSGNLPTYIINSKQYGATTNNSQAAKNALDLIRVVPNPYYAHSSYESTQFDNYVKITNLPAKYTISIFTVDGTLIKTIGGQTSYDTGAGTVYDVNNLQEPENATLWDLKNNAGVTIASGLYIIHIKADGIGEKVIKWFGVIRPLDLQDF